jgi:hypothetical protein
MTDGGEKNWLMKNVERFCLEKVLNVIGITSVMFLIFLILLSAFLTSYKGKSTMSIQKMVMGISTLM